MVTSPARAGGFTYLTVLFIVAILGGGLALVGEVWHTSAMREKEAELLFVGHQYRRAIGAYLEGTPGEVKRYPRTLEDLLHDPRRPGTERYLRKLFPDPVGGGQWGIVKAPDGGILGVHSVSEERPFKQTNFKLRDAAFQGAQKYADWQFVHTPPAKPAASKPAAKPGAKPATQPAEPEPSDTN